MEYHELIDQITPEIYQNLKQAVELGKWPNGVKLTKEQRQHSIQAVIAWEAKFKTEQERTGYMPPKEQQKAEQERELAEQADPNRDSPLNWK